MKYLVTGGSGFVGSYITFELAKDPEAQVFIYDIQAPQFKLPANVKYIEGDILSKERLSAAMTGCREVYDCAGVLGTQELVLESAKAVDVNIKGAIHVIESCLENGVDELFHPTKPSFSSYWENTYTITKIAAENFARMYKKVYGMNITLLRWMNVSGPRQSAYPVRKFIPLSICAALLGLDVELYGDGRQTMDLIDVRDVASISIKAVRSGLGKADQVWDVGLGQPLSCNDIARYIIEKTKSVSKIVYVPMRIGEAGGSKVYAKNHQELFSLIGYDPVYSSHQVIDDCIEYYQGLDRCEIEHVVNYFYPHLNISKVSSQQFFV